MFFASRHILTCFCLGSLLFAASPAVLHAAAETPATQDAASGAQNWQVIDSGTRPAYAGIQGGTAPLTILRSSNGLLFAFTGQTGNDFTLVLRGNSSNASSPRPKDHTQQPGAAEQSADAPEAALPSDRDEALSRVADEAHARQRTVPVVPETHNGKAQADTPQTGNAASIGQQALATEEKTVAAAPKAAPEVPAQTQANASAAPPSVAASTPAAPANAPSASLTLPASALPQGSSLAETLSMPAAETPTLIFASGDLASEISVSEAVVPFGLPLPGERMGTPPPPLPEVPPLKLGDYRSILNSKGSL